MAARRLAELVTWAGSSVCLVSIAVSVVVPGFVQLAAVQWSPWLVALFFLGIPHGALDHRVGVDLGPSKAARRRPGPGPGFYAAYLTAAGAVVALWFVAPIAASMGFLALAALHFGQGDLYWSRRFGLAAAPDSRGYRVVLLFVRSIVPIGLPLLVFPGEFSGTAEFLANRLFHSPSWSLASQTIAAGRVVLAAAVIVQVGWAAWLAHCGGETLRRAACVEIGETLLLVATFGIVPPVLSLGVYFNGWHSLRHVARLLLITASTRDLVASNRLLASFAEFQKRALPMTCGALALFAALGLIVGRSLVSVSDLGLVALVGLSALTLPHVLVVAWMDVRQGVWLNRPDRA